HVLERARMSSKVVRKRDASEKVGVIGRVDGKLSCIEYSDLPRELHEGRDAAGELLYGAGNIAMHVLDLEFVRELTRGGLQLPWPRTSCARAAPWRRRSLHAATSTDDLGVSSNTRLAERPSSAPMPATPFTFLDSSLAASIARFSIAVLRGGRSSERDVSLRS